MPHRLATPLLRHASRAAAAACAAACFAAGTAGTAGTAGAQSLPGALAYSAPGGAILDNRVTRFSFVVDAPDVFTPDGGLTIRFRDLAGALTGDMSAVLNYIAPGGTSVARSVRVFDGTGGHDGRSFDGSYSFGSSFLAPFGGGAVRSGDYALAQDLPAAFVGQPIAGTYQLEITDWFSNGGATVGGVDLAFDVRAASTVPEPSTVALVGVGLLATAGVARRRSRAGG